MKIKLDNADVQYVENYLSPSRALTYFYTLQRELNWQQDQIKLYGKTVAIPRLQAWYGEPRLQYRYSQLTLQSLAWTKTLEELLPPIAGFCQNNFNAVLANYYRNQKDSVAWHSDDEPELGDQPVIASLSLGTARDFQLRHKVTKQKVSLTLASGSLLVMRGDTQTYWQHCVPKRTSIIGPRINLTFRKIIN